MKERKRQYINYGGLAIENWHWKLTIHCWIVLRQSERLVFVNGGLKLKHRLSKFKAFTLLYAQQIFFHMKMIGSLFQYIKSKFRWCIQSRISFVYRIIIFSLNMCVELTWIHWMGLLHLKQLNDWSLLCVLITTTTSTISMTITISLGAFFVLFSLVCKLFFI